MKIFFTPFRQLSLAVAATLLSASGAMAAPTSALAEAQARYRHDLAVCNSGQSNQSVTTCRREAGSALAEAKKGHLDGVPDQYQRNALRRCESHSGEDRQACEARILGQGDVSSGAQAGGLLRKSITVTTPAQ